MEHEPGICFQQSIGRGSGDDGSAVGLHTKEQRCAGRLGELKQPVSAATRPALAQIFDHRLRLTDNQWRGASACESRAAE